MIEPMVVEIWSYVCRGGVLHLAPPPTKSKDHISEKKTGCTIILRGWLVGQKFEFSVLRNTDLAPKSFV